MYLPLFGKSSASGILYLSSVLKLSVSMSRGVGGRFVESPSFVLMALLKSSLLLFFYAALKLLGCKMAQGMLLE